ncbi:HTH-type transcriptional regulator YesS [Paenibacillus allorhizoplanae]|uniref:HTH-type transcriptional regulator YesS n=1 Tax=Paenibacillus allorhizoplanae TaxID=2905648 RepID=A0ABM9C0A1_9BACL|nr:AraC family transcriptional regulator [Paenibacillus allorhizoplanae]CAH1200232.1 HTH-type transcriptional regulator YesS [Paenibacillus allorhizoplanae]
MPTYLYRMILFAMLLVAIPVTTIGMISYHISSQDIEKKVKESNSQILLQNQMRIEQVLKNVEMGAVQYLNSPLVTDNLYNALTQDDFQTITSLAKGLYNLHSLSGVADTHLINLEKDWMISNLGFTHTADYSDKNLLQDYAKNPKNLFWLADEYGVRMIVKLPMIAPSAAPKALLIIEMSKTELEKGLAQTKQLGDIYVLNREHIPFLSNAGADYISDSILEPLKKVTDANGYYEGKNTAVNYRVSSNSWIYASVVSIGQVTMESKKIALVTINVCLIVFLVIASAAFYVSRRMYSPIRRLFQTMEQFGGETTESRRKDEFAYIEDRFNALFRTRKQFQQQLQGQTGQMKEFFLLKLFMGQVTESEFAFKCETYGFAEKGKPMGVIALQIDSLQDTRYMESDKELLLFAIHNIVSELLPANRLLGSLLLDQSQVSLLTGDVEDLQELQVSFHQAAEEIKDKVHELLQLKVSIGISRVFSRYTDAMNAHAEALEALKRRIRLGNDIIIHYDDIETVHENSKHLAASLNYLEDYFVNALKTGDSTSTFEHFDKYVALIMEREIRFNDFQFVMIELITEIHGLVQQQGGKLEGLIDSKSVLHSFMKLNTVQEITSWFKTELLPPALAFFKGRADSQYINLAHQMLTMIHEGFEQDITLESCAAQLKYHPVYVSRVFKKEIGVTFIDYLTNYRVNMAKKWLKETDMKISEIAERLNYANSTGFIRTFRKLTGMTPGQYRDT